MGQRALEQHPFSIEPGHAAGRYILGGEMSMPSAERLTRLVPPPGATEVTLDLSGVRFLDSGGFRAILELASGIDRSVVLVRLSDAVRNVLAMVPVDELRGIVVRDARNGHSPENDRTHRTIE